MASQWYYKTSSEEIGPLTPKDIRKAVECGVVTGNTWVRKNDSKWFQARHVSGLLTEKEKELARAAPRLKKPTLDPVAAAEQELSQANVSEPRRTANVREARRRPNAARPQRETAPVVNSMGAATATNTSTMWIVAAFVAVLTLALISVAWKVAF